MRKSNQWICFVDLRRDAGGPLRRRLERELRQAVQAGRLVPGTALPSSRALAAQLGVSRGMVVEAYAQLVAEGYLSARQGAATVVAARHATAPAPATRSAAATALAGRPGAATAPAARPAATAPAAHPPPHRHRPPATLVGASTPISGVNAPGASPRRLVRRATTSATGPRTCPRSRARRGSPRRRAACARCPTPGWATPPGTARSSCAPRSPAISGAHAA